MESCASSLSHSLSPFFIGKRRYNIKLWKTFTDCFNCLPVAAIVDEKIFCMHGGLSPELQNMEQIKRIMRPTGKIYEKITIMDYLSIFIDIDLSYSFDKRHYIIVITMIGRIRLFPMTDKSKV